MFHQIAMEIAMEIAMNFHENPLMKSLGSGSNREVHPHWAAPPCAAHLFCGRPAWPVWWQMVVDHGSALLIFLKKHP